MKSKRLKKRQSMINKLFDMRIIRLGIVMLIVVSLRITDDNISNNTFLNPGFVAFLYFLFEIYLTIMHKKSFISYLENFDFCLSDTTGVSLVKYPAPVVIIDLSGEIKWYNSNFKNLMGGKEIFGVKVHSLIPQIEVNKLVESRGEFGSVVKIGDFTYEIEARIAGREDKNSKHKFLILYNPYHHSSPSTRFAWGCTSTLP